MLQITLMTLHFLDNHGGQSLAARQGMLAIFFLGMYHAQGLDGARDGAQAQGQRTRGLPSHHGIHAAYSQSTRASTGSVLLRSPRDSAKRRARRGLTRLTSTWP